MNGCRRLTGVLIAALGVVARVAYGQGSVATSPALVPHWATAKAPLVFANVTVIDVRNGRHLPAQTVVIVGSRVSAVGAAVRVPVPKGARVVNARGKYLIPGLWDMHAHPLAYTDLFYPLFIANGVTGVREPGSSAPLTTLTRWKQDIAAGMRVGPRLFVAGPTIIECPVPDMGWEGATAHAMCVSTPGEARLLVDFIKLAGADFIKLRGLKRELSLAIVAEARRLAIPFGGHFNPEGFSGQEASDSGARFLDHETWFNPNICGEYNARPFAFDRVRCAAAAERLRRNGTWLVVTPMMFGIELFPQLGYEHMLPYVPDSVATRMKWAERLAGFAARRDSVAPALPRLPRSFADWVKAKEALEGPDSRILSGTADSAAPPSSWKYYSETRGLPIVAGTDAAMIFGNHAGFGVHTTLANFVLGGMSPLEALQTATLNAAEALHVSDSLGTVAPGKLADLVLLDADPLTDIWNTTKIRAVVANGRYFDRVALDGLLAAAKRRAHH